MRFRGKPLTRQTLSEMRGFVAEPGEYKGSWKELFGNGNDIHIELGCGRGGFITEAASQNGDINFIAFERISKIIALAIKSTEETPQGNLLFVNADAAHLDEYFAEGEISRIYINFCDPWRDKSKWHKRRLTHGNFLTIYERLLRNGGELFFKTDNEILFDFSVKELTKLGWQLACVTKNLHSSGYEGNIMTEYEKKFSEKGIPILRLEATKGNL